MGVCLSYLSLTTSTDDIDEILGPQQNYSYTEIPPTPTITPQTPTERGLSKIVSQRPSKRRASIVAQIQPTESTPLLPVISDSNCEVTEASNVREESDDEGGDHDNVKLDDSSISTDRNPFPDINVEPFYRHSREMSSHRAKNFFWLRSYWETVSAGLRPGPWIEKVDTEFICLRSLHHLSTLDQPEEILHYLSWFTRNHEILSQVADQHLKRLLQQDYSTLTTLAEPIIVPQPFLESGSYVVRNFWTALHVILQFSLPPDRCLKEYLQIFMVLQKCLARAMKKFQDTYQGLEELQIPSKISLLVFLPSYTPSPPLQIPNVSIGFDLSGNNPILNGELLNDRRVNLPILNILERNQSGTSPVGICGETETLAYTCGVPRGIILDKFRLILVNLTLDFMSEDVVPVRMCQESKKLVEMLRDKHRVLVSLDLAPPYPKQGRY